MIQDAREILSIKSPAHMVKADATPTNVSSSAVNSATHRSPTTKQSAQSTVG